MIWKKKYYLFFIIVVIIFLIIAIYFIYLDKKNESTIELETFRELARNADCADLINNLFLIDDKMVFWIVEGSCTDASYSYTLFGNDTNIILCKEFDTIVGPKRECFDDNYKDIFQMIIENIDSDNFGLGLNHKVEEIIF